MPTRRVYTIRDVRNAEVQKGDQVTITFTGEVREVTREGNLVVKSPNGYITAVIPSFQNVIKTSK